MTARRRTWIVAGAVVCAALLAVAGGVWWGFGRLLPYAEGQATAGIGRAVRIGGISVNEWSWTPVIAARDVRIADADWRGEGPMVAVDAVMARLDLSALLRFELVLTELRILRPQVRLGVDADGRQSWTIDSEGAEAGGKGPIDRQFMPRIEHVAITDGTLVYSDAIRAIELEATLATATGDTNGDINIEARGTLEASVLTASFVGGPIVVLHDTDVPYPIRIEVVAGPNRLNFAGTAADPFGLDGLDGSLDVAGANLAEVAALVGLAAPDTPAFALKGRLARSGERWGIADLAGTVGSSDIAGTLGIDATGEKPMITGDLVSRKLDLYELGPIVGLPARTAPDPPRKDRPVQERAARAPSGDTPGDSDAAPQAADGRVLPDAPLDLERLDRVNAQIVFRGDNILAPDLPLRDVSLTLDVLDRRLTLSPLKFGLRGGTVSGEVVIHGEAVPVRSEVNAAFSHLDLAQLVGGTEDNAPITGQLYGRTRLTLLGNTVRRGMGNANGRLAMAMTGGEIDALAVEAAGLDIGQALLALGDDERFPVRCMAMAFNARDGLFVAEVFVLDTTDSQLVATGTVDMRDETLHLEMLAHPKDASIGSARTAIAVGGTLADPSVAPKVEGLAGRGAAAIALGVLLGPLAAILPFIEPGLAEDADCGALIGNTGLPAGAEDHRAVRPGTQAR